jgi:hypothetical protein
MTSLPTLYDVTVIIARLGGTPEVADCLGLSKWAVYKWQRRGIPGHRYSSVLALASELGVDLSLQDIERANATTLDNRP